MKSRGFVLSFAILTVALFILVYAQIQSEQLFSLRYHDSQTWENTLPLRAAQDASMDLNALYNQRISVDQNSTNVYLTVGGIIPVPLSFSSNIMRYQNSLASLGRDLNLSIFADFNAVISDGNLLGQTNTGFSWKQGMDRNMFYGYSQNAFARPTRIDINLSVDSNYNASNSWSLNPTTGDVYIILNYSDTNSQHDSSSSGWADYIDLNVFTWQYEVPLSGGGFGNRAITLSIGQIDQNQGAFLLDNNGGHALTLTYSIRFSLDANTSLTRAGYSVPLRVVGPDANVVQGVQYLYE